MGVNMDSLRPEPCVEGYSTPAGYSSRAVKPIALAKVMAISRMIGEEFGGGRSVSGIGGVESGRDAAEFILLGSSTVQVCTGVMVHGYPLVQRLCGELQDFMAHHRFDSIAAFRGHSLPYFTTHSDLVARQRAARPRAAARAPAPFGTAAARLSAAAARRGRRRSRKSALPKRGWPATRTGRGTAS